MHFLSVGPVSCKSIDVLDEQRDSSVRSCLSRTESPGLRCSLPEVGVPHLATTFRHAKNQYSHTLVVGMLLAWLSRIVLLYLVHRLV